MKYGMHSCGLKSYSFKEGLKLAARYGYDGFELDIFPWGNDRKTWETYRDGLIADIPELLGIMKSEKIEICSLCLGVLWLVNIAGINEEEKALGVDIIKDCIQIGSKLGAKCLLLPIGQPEEVSPTVARDNLYHSIMKCVGAAEKANIVLAVENVVQRILWDSKDLIELVDRVDSPFCKVYYDVGNPYFVNINSKEEILQLGNRIFQIHIKDMTTVEPTAVETNDKSAENEEKEIGKAEDVAQTVRFRGDTSNWKGVQDNEIGIGMVNWNGIVKAIKEIGYDRYLVTEIKQDQAQPDRMAKINADAARKVVEENF